MKFETEVELTPKQLAEAYWNLKDTEQSEFFTELFKVAGMSENYFDFESQAFYLHNRIREENMSEAKEALMSLAAPFFLHTLREQYY